MRPRWSYLLVLLCGGLALLATDLAAQNLTVRVSRQQHLVYSQLTNTGPSSQPVTHPTVGVYRVRARRHNTQNRTLDVDITLPTIPVVTQWNIAYTIDADDPATSTATTASFSLTVPPKSTAGNNNMFVYIYIYVDVNFGSTAAEYEEPILVSGTLSEI